MKDIRSKLILGTVQFGQLYGVNNSSGKPNETQVNEIFLTAHSNGIGSLDSAEAYGDAHRLIGNFHRRTCDKQFKVISKLPHGYAADPVTTIERYLDELGIDQMEALLFHSYKTYIEADRALWATLEHCGDMINAIGVSIYNNEQMASVIDDERVKIIQLPFNLLDNYSQRGMLISKAKAKGKIVHVRSAFLQGLFFIQRKHVVADALASEILTIRNIAAEMGVSVSSLALNYCLQQEEIDGVLIGVDTKDQLLQNLHNAGEPIPSEYLRQINDIHIQTPELLNPATWN